MATRVLVLGGHGKIALLLTPMLLARSWQVTSVIRNPDHEVEIRTAAKNQPGNLNVLVSSLDDVKSELQAKSIIDSTKPNYVVWAAGAGGKGGLERTYAIDRDAAQHFIRASVKTPSVTKFLMISYIGSRRNRPHWWSDEDWASAQKTNMERLPDYAKAKVVADETLTALSLERGSGFQGICLRPGTLSADPPTGKVAMGHITSQGKVTRADVADVAAHLLEEPGARGYFDLLNGDEDVSGAVKRVVKHGVDAIEGEDVQAMKNAHKL